MNKEDIQTLFAYNTWANQRIMDAAAKVPAEQYAAPSHLSHGGLRATLTHLIGVEILWYQRMRESVSPTVILKENEAPAFDDLHKLWLDESKAWDAYIASLSDADFLAVKHYQNMEGAPKAEPLWQVLAHVVNHGTQTRSEAGVALTDYNCSPGDLDFIMFVRERQPGLR